MRLKDLLHYRQVMIQCHDNPDADTLGSAYGVYCYLKAKAPEMDVHIIYGGEYRIEKSNLKLMIELLDIPVEYRSCLDPPELLLTVDAQYGNGNIHRFPAQHIAVIDHHQISSAELFTDIESYAFQDVCSADFCEIRTTLGSCCTVVYELLCEEDFDINRNQNLASALFYGLYMDTKKCSEISAVSDRRLRDEAQYDKDKLRRLQNANLSLKELEIAGRALLGYHYEPRGRYAIVKAEPCDPNLLGLISDFILEVDAVDVALVYSVLPFGIKLSVRSCTDEVNADELAEYMTWEAASTPENQPFRFGSGGGHRMKAGGFLNRKLFLKAHPEISLTDEQEVRNYFCERMHVYFAKDE